MITSTIFLRLSPFFHGTALKEADILHTLPPDSTNCPGLTDFMESYNIFFTMHA